MAGLDATDRRLVNTRPSFEVPLRPADVQPKAKKAATQHLLWGQPSGGPGFCRHERSQPRQVRTRFELVPDVQELARLLRRDPKSVKLSADGRKLEANAASQSVAVPIALAESQRRELLRLASLPEELADYKFEAPIHIGYSSLEDRALVRALLYMPRFPPRGQKRPLVIQIHGGPAWQRSSVSRWVSHCRSVISADERRRA